MPLRRTPLPDPDVAARLAQLLPAVGGGWVLPGPEAVESDDASDSPERLLSPGRLRVVAGRPDFRGGEPGPDGAVDPGAADDAHQPSPPAPPSGPAGVLDMWRAGRISPGGRGALALGLVALLAGLLTVGVVVRGRPQEVVPPPVVAAGVPVPGSDAAEQAPTGGEVVVSVGGRVKRPGLVRLPAGSRVDDAVRAAGGARRPSDLSLVNLARRLVDGEQVLVGVAAPEPAAAGPAGAAAGPVDLNTATLAQLDALPGIGPVLAQRILDWRTENGRFGSVDQLREVSGIGEATYAKLRTEVRV